MSAIRTMCLHCISPVDLDPAEILLLAAPSAAGTGSYAYHCRGCEHVTVVPVSAAGFALLVTAGVQAPTLGPPRPGHRLTVDDLIELHRLLNTEDWFAQLLRFH